MVCIRICTPLCTNQCKNWIGGTKCHSFITPLFIWFVRIESVFKLKPIWTDVIAKGSVPFNRLVFDLKIWINKIHIWSRWIPLIRLGLNQYGVKLRAFKTLIQDFSLEFQCFFVMCKWYCQSFQFLCDFYCLKCAGWGREGNENNQNPKPKPPPWMEIVTDLKLSLSIIRNCSPCHCDA